MGHAVGEQLPPHDRVAYFDLRLLPALDHRPGQKTLSGLIGRLRDDRVGSVLDRDHGWCDFGDDPGATGHHSAPRRLDVHFGEDQQETADPHHAQDRVEYEARAEKVGEPPPKGPDQTRRQREDRRHQSGGDQRHGVHVDIVRNQPLSERHEATEDQEVIEPEAPHPHVRQRGQHHLESLGVGALGLLVFRAEEEQNGHDDERRGVVHG